MKLFNPILFFSTASVLLLGSCKKEENKPDYRGEMKTFVEKISAHGRNLRPGFIVIPQNGLPLLSSDGTAGGAPDHNYIAAIDGVGQEELWYGYDNNDDVLTPEPDHSDLRGMCAFARVQGLKVMVTDYCSSHPKMDDSYTKNLSDNFVSFTANHRELDNIPDYPALPFQVDSGSVQSLGDMKNFLYIINPSAYNSKEEFLHALEQTNYDAFVLDLFYDDHTTLNSTDLARLRVKPNGGSRKLICYMSIGEAENYRWYWKPFWNVTPPSFLVGEDPDWLNNYTVRYWDPAWQYIICGNTPDSYLNKIVDAGFDGVYLDLVSEYEYFESK
jgi:cysteinyl-tRNA synthetase